MNATFGEFLRSLRLAEGYNLRQFAAKVGMQPSNYCSVESGSLPPPGAERLSAIAEALRLSPRSRDYERLCDLAAKARDEIPADVARIVKESEMIPALLRTVENERISEHKLKGIIEDLKSGRYKTKRS